MFNGLSRHGAIAEQPFWITTGRSYGFLCSWLILAALLFGLCSILLEQTLLLPFFFAAAYAVLLLVGVRTARLWQDLLNPLGLVLTIGLVRFCIPGLLFLSGIEPPEEVSLLFRMMKLSDNDWRWAHALVLIGLLSVVMGWLLLQPQWSGRQRLKFYLSGGVKYAALAGMLVGFIAFALFFFSNASLDSVTSGGFRGTTIQEGTGKYFRLSYLLMAGSVLFSCYLMGWGKRWVSLAPVGVSMALYWVLGGRSRAVTALAGGLILLWYLSRERKGWGGLILRPAYLIVAPIGAFVAVWLSYVGVLYRGELGVRAFSQALSLTGLWEYVGSSVYVDIGQLHSLAGAIAIGPGVLGGQTFIGALTWPLGKFMLIPGRSAGVFIVDTLVGFKDEQTWGVNASLIGDAYLNFGLGGVVLVMLLYGALLKLLYLKFRQGSLHSAIYTLALLSALQAFWVSIEVWPQALITLAFTLMLMLLGRTIFQLRSGETARPA